MFRQLTNNYRKMHHLPKFRRGANKYRLTAEARHTIHLMECESFAPFLEFVKSFYEGETHAEVKK